MAFKKTFVLSDESINTYGFWVMLSGMDLSLVQKNCPLYYEHRTWEIPCGHVENIRLKNSQVLGDIVIEGGNDVEKEYIRKIENGDLKGCSFGIDPVEWSEAPENIKQGQTRATLSKCQPYELSLAPLPGNGNALALRNGNDMITLTADKEQDFIPLLNKKTDMKNLAILLGKGENATEQELMEAIRPLQLKATNADAMQKIIVDKIAVNLTAENKNFFETILPTNVNQAMEFIALAKTETPAEVIADADATAVVEKTAVLKDIKVSDMIKLAKAKPVTPAADGKDCYDYLQRHDSIELGRIKKEDPEKFAELQAGYAKGVRYEKK